MTKKIVTVFSMLMLLSFQAKAADKGTIELKSVAEVEVIKKNDKGETEMKRVEASKEKVVPGDAVIFTTYYTNIDDKPATDVIITNPVPEHMVYIDGTAEVKGASVVFSVDNGKEYAPAGKLKVKNAAGKERPAVASDYTHIRWTLEKPLEKGKKGSVSFRAKVK